MRKTDLQTDWGETEIVWFPRSNILKMVSAKSCADVRACLHLAVSES
jgi:hypothetical protein